LNKKTATFLWIADDSHKPEAFMAFAVESAKGIDGAADCAVGEVQAFFDDSEGAGFLLGNDQEDLGEVDREVRWI